MSAQPLRLGISACLLGQPVRYNAGHKHSNLCNQVLAPVVEYVSFCPEQAAGFGTPRPAMHLRGAAGHWANAGDDDGQHHGERG